MKRTMQRRETLPPPFEADRRRVEAHLASRFAHLPGVPLDLARALRYAVLAPGKRLRPLLVLLGYDAAGGPARLRSRVLPAAGALECVHAFSLVHDDLPALDNDDLRRGRPTLHRKFGEATAILAGDALLALAFEDLAGLAGDGGFPAERVLAAARDLARASGAAGMVAGQVLDLAAERRPRVTTAAVRAIHLRKTGELLATALTVGGRLAGGSTRALRALHAIGLDLGVAFQIADDLLNERSDHRALGKAAGSDRARGKATWPRAAGASASERAVRMLSRRAARRAQVFPPHQGHFVTLTAFLAARRA